MAIRRWGPRRPRRAKPHHAEYPKHLTVAMTQEMWAKVKAESYKEKKSASAWIRDAIERKLK